MPPKEDNSLERQKYQLHKKGYEDITKAISSRPEVQKMELLGAELVTIKGQKGDKGDKGDKGEKGDSITGPQGPTGKDSTVPGPKGPIGLTGKDGKNGKDGTNGLNGKDGKNGKDGNNGSPDSPADIVSKLQTVKKAWLNIDAIDGDFNKKIRQIIHTGGATGVTEAPIDGNQYARKNGGWEEVVASGGSAWGDITGTLSNQTDLQSALDAKQATLVSGTNIKTINGSSILGAGDLVVGGSITVGDTQVLFADGANNPAGDAGLTYNKTTDALTIAGSQIVPLISGSTAANGDITINGTTDATKTTSYVILQETGGNVGIGTATPTTAKLEVAGVTGTTKGAIINNGTSTGNIFEAQDNGTAVFTVADGGDVTTTARYIAPVNAASYVFGSGYEAYGIGLSSAHNRIQHMINGNVFAAVSSSNGFEVSNDGITFFSGTVNAGTADTRLYREAAATLQMGVDVNGSAVNQTFKAHDGITGTDISGASLILAGGRGTGAGTPGSLIWQTATPLGSGTTAQTLVTRMTLTGDVLSLTGSATQAGELRFYEDTDSGTNYTSFKAGVQAGDIVYTLPTAYPAVTGYVLSATDAGVMSWVANGSGGGGGMTWNEETGTSATMSVDNGYIANNAALVTLTLPTTAAVGKVIRVSGKGAGGWKIAQNASEIIHFGSSDTTTGTGGSLASTATRDAVELVCVVADTEWNVISSIGNITIV